MATPRWMPKDRDRAWFDVPARLVLAAILTGVLASCCSTHARADETCPGGVCVAPLAPQTVTLPLVAVPDLTLVVGGVPVPQDGITSFHDGQPARVEMNAGLEEHPGRACYVAAHELGHVLGLDHVRDVDSLMQNSPTTRTPPLSWPSPMDLVNARALVGGRRFVLRESHDMTPAIRRAVVWAVATWNAALETEVLILGGDS